MKPRMIMLFPVQGMTVTAMSKTMYVWPSVAALDENGGIWRFQEDEKGGVELKQVYQPDPIQPLHAEQRPDWQEEIHEWKETDTP